MIVVTRTDKTTGHVTRVEIPEGKDPFAVLSVVQRHFAIPSKNDEAPRTSLEASERIAGVRHTSRDAYHRARVNGKLTAQQQAIVEWMRGHIGSATRQEIAKGTGIAINAVCGRVNELLDPALGVLREAGKRKCRVTGETAYALVLR